MNEITVFNKETAEIIRHVRCQPDTMEHQVNAKEGYVLGHYDKMTYKIDPVDMVAILLSEEEQADTLYETRVKLGFNLGDKSLTDEALNTQVYDFFLGKKNVAVWRVENYSRLRAFFYPETAEKTDAEVKIGSGIDEYVAEGNLQLQQYYSDCIDVKIRFAKE